MTILTQFWNFFASVKLAIFTLCALAITSIIGTLIPQGENSAFYVNNFGAKTAYFFQILDIPNMYYSWWFLGLLGLLSANLIICSIERFPTVWKIMTKDNLNVGPDRICRMSNFIEIKLSAKNPGGVDAQELLKKNGWRVTSKREGDNELFFSQKGRWSRIGVYIVHLSILIIFLGAIVGHFFGFKGSVMVPELNSTTKVFGYKNSGNLELGYEVRCNRFTIEFYDNGMPKEYMSSLTVLEDGQEVLTTNIEVNSPLTYKGTTFYQSSYQGYQDFVITVTDKSSGDSKQFVIPFQKQSAWQDKDIHFGIINAEAVGQRVVRSKLWFRAGENPASTLWLTDNTTTTLKSGPVEYTVSAKQMYATGLQVARDPGVWIVYIGCGIMLLGLYMAFFMSHQRIWLYLERGIGEPRLLLSGSANKNKVAFGRVYDRLKKDIEQAVHQ